MLQIHLFNLTYNCFIMFSVICKMWLKLSGAAVQVSWFLQAFMSIYPFLCYSFINQNIFRMFNCNFLYVEIIFVTWTFYLVNLMLSFFSFFYLRK